MLEKLSLKARIMAVALIPLVAFTAISGLSFFKDYQSLQEASQTISKIDVIEAASAVVHESQKERGKSAAYLNGGLALDNLNAQRAVNDKKLEVLRDLIPKSSFKQEYKDQLFSTIEKYQVIRKKVSSKDASLGEALKTYTGIIKTFLNIQLDVANETSFPQLAAKLRSFRILEGSKESGGKLRANMSAVLAKNAPITDKKFTAIVKLNSGVGSGLASSGLILDEKSKKFITNFNNSSSWAEVQDVFKLILTQSKSGNYNKNAKDFFSTITNALNIIGSLIIYQKDLVKEEIYSIQNAATTGLWQMGGVLLFFMCAIFWISLYISKTTSSKIQEIGSKLTDNSQSLLKSSEFVFKTSESLSQSAETQSTSLQETAATVDEISGMAQRSAEAANSSKDIASKSMHMATEGEEKVKQMIRSIQDISQSNDDIMSEIQQNNDEISKIISLISEIGEKTKVINDIVFQTKLLSFNASVEAARAGEHGKGFAVVAEEVGNLASMSGNAALEISEMLDSSIKQVSDIVKNSKDKVDGLVQKGRTKIETGNNIAKECGDTMRDIRSNFQTVDQMIKEIALASSEQSTGIHEMAKALQSLDEVSHKTAKMSQDTSGAAVDLSEASNEISKIVKTLDEIINSSGKSQTPKKKSENNVLPMKGKQVKKTPPSQKNTKVS